MDRTRRNKHWFATSEKNVGAYCPPRKLGFPSSGPDQPGKRKVGPCTANRTSLAIGVVFAPGAALSRRRHQGSTLSEGSLPNSIAVARSLSVLIVSVPEPSGFGCQRSSESGTET